MSSAYFRTSVLLVRGLDEPQGSETRQHFSRPDPGACKERLLQKVPHRRVDVFPQGQGVFRHVGRPRKDDQLLPDPGIFARSR